MEFFQYLQTNIELIAAIASISFFLFVMVFYKPEDKNKDRYKDGYEFAQDYFDKAEDKLKALKEMQDLIDDSKCFHSYDTFDKGMEQFLYDKFKEANLSSLSSFPQYPTGISHIN